MIRVDPVGFITRRSFAEQSVRVDFLRLGFDNELVARFPDGVLGSALSFSFIWSHLHHRRIAERRPQRIVKS